MLSLATYGSPLQGTSPRAVPKGVAQLSTPAQECDLAMPSSETRDTPYMGF